MTLGKALPRSYYSKQASARKTVCIKGTKKAFHYKVLSSTHILGAWVGAHLFSWIIVDVQSVQKAFGERGGSDRSEGGSRVKRNN